MLQLEHMQKIVDSCYPSSLEEAAALFHEIKPIKFGNAQPYGTDIELAAYQIPENSAYLLILRTECYMTTFTAAAPGFGQFSPPPSGTAQWQYTDISPTTPEYRLSPIQPIHIFADTDEFLFAKGDHRIALFAQLAAAPDANPRIIRTTVYGYLVGGLIADRLGATESTYFGV